MGWCNITPKQKKGEKREKKDKRGEVTEKNLDINKLKEKDKSFCFCRVVFVATQKRIKN